MKSIENNIITIICHGREVKFKIGNVEPFLSGVYTSHYNNNMDFCGLWYIGEENVLYYRYTHGKEHLEWNEWRDSDYEHKIVRTILTFIAEKYLLEDEND